MRTIWKFPLAALPLQNIRAPKGASFISAHAQDEIPCLWAIVDTNEPLEDRTVTIRGTGHELFDAHVYNFIGTVLLDKDALVLHVFVS